jgi:hypothetical protein
LGYRMTAEPAVGNQPRILRPKPWDAIDTMLVLTEGNGHDAVAVGKGDLQHLGVGIEERLLRRDGSFETLDA